MTTTRSSNRPTNRLVREASPYLLQHSLNPVDWYPWGDEALQRARKEDKPIFLSIGYSACHWCHVMERESFEDVEIAHHLNHHFVCIKVDREERPDLDHIYQTVIQLMGRSGGWPLSMFLTPEQRPFFGGTYFPPEDRYGLPSFVRILEAVYQAFHLKRSEIEEQSLEITAAISDVAQHDLREAASYAPSATLIAEVGARLLTKHDKINGGFGSRPKFPNTMCLKVLLRAAQEPEGGACATALARSLEAMQSGGVYDQIGGGFHRYSTDERWLVPHFEKMLYDNALLIRLYAQASVALDNPSFAATASDIGTWMLREMQDHEGGLYATEDADSEGAEGKYFVFDAADIRAALGEDTEGAEIAIAYFGVTDVGNFENSGKTVLSRIEPLQNISRARGVSEETSQRALTRAQHAMLVHREHRVRPFRDEKVLASWNGLAISGLVEAAMCLEEPALLAAARLALEFAERNLITGGDVARLIKGGLVKDYGFLDDHAFLCVAALDVYEATGEFHFAELAEQIAHRMVARFWDGDQGCFFFTPNGGESLIARTSDQYDQAVPSGASMASLALLRLATLVDPTFGPIARVQLERLAPAAYANPFAFGQTLCVLDRLVRGSTEIVIVGRLNDPTSRALHAAAWRRYVPNRLVAWVDPHEERSVHAARLLVEGRLAGPHPMAYVCRSGSCSPPVTTPDALIALL